MTKAGVQPATRPTAPSVALLPRKLRRDRPPDSWSGSPTKASACWMRSCMAVLLIGALVAPSRLPGPRSPPGASGSPATVEPAPRRERAEVLGSGPLGVVVVIDAAGVAAEQAADRGDALEHAVAEGVGQLMDGVRPTALNTLPTEEMTDVLSRSLDTLTTSTMASPTKLKSPAPDTWSISSKLSS